MLNRRQFLGRAAAGLSILSLSGQAPGLFCRAADEAVKRGSNDRILVVVELNGGNDGLNTVIPFENDLYFKNRPTLGIPKDQVVKLNDQVGLHPSLEPLATLFKDGKLGIVQGVGYPEPDRSHFRSMEIWHTASTASKPPSTGWLGRVADHHFNPADAERLLGLSLTGGLPQAFQADKTALPVAQYLEALSPGEGETGRQKLLRKLTTAPDTKADPVGFLRRQAAAVYRAAAKLRQATESYRSDVEYAGALADPLQRAAQVIAADLGVRVLFLSQATYDTHSQQAGTHQQLFTDLALGLSAFQKDMEKQKTADRVLVMCFSEFGRRVDENASQGTDHGAASVLFLAGSKVKGGLEGKYPSLEKLGDSDLVHTTDFRSVYATVLEQWLGCPAEKLLGAKYPQLDLLGA